MPSFCCVVNCGSTRSRDDVHFFRIPAVLHFKHKTNLNELSAKRRQKWLSAIRRADFPENKQKNAVVCSKHFISGKPAELTDELNPDWTPSLNMGYNNTLSARRMERFKRNRKKLVDELEDDMENYIRYKFMGGKITLKNRVVPHIFECEQKTEENYTHSEFSTAMHFEQPSTSSYQDKSEKVEHTQQSAAEIEPNKSIGIQVKPRFRSKYVTCKIKPIVRHTGTSP